MRLINKSLIFSRQVTPESGVLAQFHGILVDKKNLYTPILYCIDYDAEPSINEIKTKIDSLKSNDSKYEVVMLFVTMNRYDSLFKRSILMANAYGEYEKLIDDKVKELTKNKL